MRSDFHEYFLIGIFVLSNSIGSDDLHIDTILEDVFGLVEAFIDVIFVSEFDVAMSIGSFGVVFVKVA